MSVVAAPWRLATIAPDVVEYLESSDEERLRRIASAVANLAALETGLDDETADAALATLRGEQDGGLQQRAAVEALVDQLDADAWALQDRVDSGEPLEADYLRAFRRARAASALSFALDPDPLVAAIESVYEARAATDDPTVRSVVATVLD